MKYSIIISALAGTMLCSCVAYKKYQPVTTVPENLYGLEHSAADTALIAGIRWQEIFTDNDLRSLIDTALVRNTDYLVAQLQKFGK